MLDIEYCKDCLDGKCYTHKWFTDKKPKTEKEVLITYLKQVKERMFHVFERTYLVENVIHGWGMDDIDVGGTLKFRFDFIPWVHKKDDVYIPISSYTGSGNIVNYEIYVEIMLMRHHPTDLIIKQGILSDDELYRIQLIDFNDSLHCESIRDVPLLIKLTKKRLSEFINNLQKNQSDMDTR